MTVARARGKLKGCQPKLSARQQAEVVRMHATGEYTIAELMEVFSVGCAPGGAERTVAYVADSGHQQRENLLGHLHQLQAATDEDVNALIAERRQYYSDALRDLDDSPGA